MPPQPRKTYSYKNPRDNHWFQKELAEELRSLVWGSFWKSAVIGLVFLIPFVIGVIVTLARVRAEPIFLGTLLGVVFAFVVEALMRRWIYNNSITFRHRKLREFRKTQEELDQYKPLQKDDPIKERIPHRLKEVTELIKELEEQMKPPVMKLVGKTSAAIAQDLYSNESPEDVGKREQVA